MYNNKFHEEDLTNYTFLVTGAAGFIGSHLIEYLVKYKAGKIIALDNLATGYKKNIEPFINYKNVEYIEGDIRNAEICRKACEGVDFVWHQAALGSVPRSINNPVTTNEVNVDGFLNMLVAAKDSGVKRFIYASSSSAYGDNMRMPKVEEEIGKPLSPYAATKVVNEMYADVFYKIYGLKSIGFRYFNIFGPRQNTKGPYAAVIPIFITSALNNEPLLVHGDGTQSRDFTFVENVVQANIKASFTSNEEAFNKVFNIALGDTTSLNDIINMLREFSGKDIGVVHASPRPGDVKDSLADIAKAQRLLGYEPSVRIREGLERTFNWFKNNQKFINS